MILLHIYLICLGIQLASSSERSLVDNENYFEFGTDFLSEYNETSSEISPIENNSTQAVMMIEDADLSLNTDLMVKNLNEKINLERNDETRSNENFIGLNHDFKKFSDKPLVAISQTSTPFSQVNLNNSDSNPITYKYDNALEKDLSYDIAAKRTREDSELVKRESTLEDLFSIDRIKIERTERVKINHELLSKQNFAIINAKGKVLICSAIADGRLQIVLVNTKFEEEKKIYTNGKFPCHMLMSGTDILLLHIDNNLDKLIVSKIVLDQENVKELEVFHDYFEGQPTEISSWEQNGIPYCALKITKNNTSSFKTEFWIYVIKNGRLNKLQILRGKSLGSLHFFQIDVDFFIALPNFVDKGMTEQSEVFKFSYIQNKYKFFQNLTTGKATSVSSLKRNDGEKTFLIITRYCEDEDDFCDPYVSTSIFQYNGKEFELFQKLRTTGAIKSIIIKHKSEDFLLIASPLKGISVYQFANNMFAEEFPKLNKKLLEGMSDIFHIDVDTESFIGVKPVSDSKYTWELFKVNFDTVNTISFSTISDWCYSAIERLNSEVERLKKETLLDFETIKEKLYQVRTKKTSPEEEGIAYNIVNHDVYSDIKTRANNLTEDIQVLKKTLQMIENKINQTINIDETIDWPDDLHMSSIVILAAKINGFYVENINEERIPTVDELIPLNGEFVAMNLHTKYFSDIEFHQELWIQNLNDQPLSSYITRNGNHKINGHVIFKKLSTPKIEVGGLIDGIKISNETVLLKTGSSNFKGSLKCKSVYISNLETDYINNVNVKELMRNTFVQNSNVTIKGDLNIFGDLIYPGDLKTGTIFGRNASFYENELLYLNSGRPQFITGSYNFKNIRSHSIQIGQTLNGIPFSESVFVNLPIKVYSLSKARFDSIAADVVHIDKSINEIKVFDGELDLFTLNDNQIIVGKKSFNGMHLKNYIILRNQTSLDPVEKYFSTIENEENLDKELQFYRTSAKLRETRKSETEILTFLYTVRTKLIRLIDTNPVTVHLSSIPYDENVYPEVSDVISSLASDLNDLRKGLLTENFYDIEDKLDISERDVIQLNKLSSFKTLPNYLSKDVQEFYAALDQIYGIVVDIIASKRTVTTTLEENLRVYDRKIVKEVEKHHVSDIRSKGSFVRDLICGYDFRNLSSMMRRRQPESLRDETSILNKVKNAEWVIFMKGLNTPYINKVNINRLIEESVPFSLNDTNLNLIFEESVVVQKNVETLFINNDLASKFAKINEVNVFEKGTEFQDLRFFADVEVKGNVNGVKLNEFASKVARTNRPQKFIVPISFNSVTADIVNASVVTLNGIPLDDFVFSYDGNVLITGKKQFANISVLNSLAAIENLHTEEMDKIDLSKLGDRRKVERDVTIDGETSLKKLFVKGNVNILRYLRSTDNEDFLNITRLYENSVRYGQDETIYGSMEFKGNVRINSLNYSSLFDGISSKTFDEGFVLQEEDQTLYDSNFFKTLRVRNLVIKNNVLQGVNFSRIVNEAAKIDENHEFSDIMFFGNITSRNPIKVNGLVQGWNLTRETVLKTESAVITGRKTFLAPVFTTSDLIVHGLVNEMNLGKICNSIVGEVEIKGPVHFAKDIIAERVQIGSHIIPNNFTTYWNGDKTVLISTDVVFENIESERIHILNELNGESVRNILEGPIPSNCMRSLKMENLTVHKLACDTLHAKEIQVNKLDGANSTILNNMVLNEFHQTFEDDLKISNLEIKGQLTVGKTINGFHMTDFCLKHYPCQIESHKTFLNDVTVYKTWDIENESHINNISVEDMKTSNFTATRIVIIKGSLHAPAITVDGLIHGIKFGADTIMTLSTPQTMNRTFFVSNKGNLAFEAANIKVLSQLYNDVNITALEPYSQAKDDDDANLSPLLEKYENLTYEVLRVHATLRDQPLRFDGFEVISKFEGNQIIPLEEQRESKVFLLAIISSDGIHIKNYIPHTRTYKDYVYLKVNRTSDVKGFYIKDDLFISAGVRSANQNMDLNEVLLVSPDGISINENVFSYVWKITSSSPVLYAAIATGKVDQIISFKISYRNCILFLSKEDVTQNILCEDKNSLILHQSLELRRVIKALHFDVESREGKKPVLVIGSEDSLKQMPVINVLEYTKNSNNFEVIQRLNADQLVWLSSLNFNGNYYVASVHKPFIGSLSGHVNIYRLEEIWLNGRNRSGLRLSLQESIYVADPLQATLLKSPSGEIVLFLLNKNEFIMRYVKRGYGKFQLAGSMHIPGANSLSSWAWERVNSYNVAVSVKMDAFESCSNSSEIIVLKPIYFERNENLNAMY